MVLLTISPSTPSWGGQQHEDTAATSSSPLSSPRLPGPAPPASAPATCPGTKQLPFTAWTIPKVWVMHTGPRRLRATQDTILMAAREPRVCLSFQKGDLPGAPWSCPYAVRGEAGGTPAQLLASLPFPPPHLTDNTSNVLLVLRSEVRGNLHQHGWLALARQHVPLHQHLQGNAWGNRAVRGWRTPPASDRGDTCTHCHKAAQGQAPLSLHGAANGTDTLRHRAWGTGPAQDCSDSRCHGVGGSLPPSRSRAEHNTSLLACPLLEYSALVNPTPAADQGASRWLCPPLQGAATLLPALGQTHQLEQSRRCWGMGCIQCCSCSLGWL